LPINPANQLHRHRRSQNHSATLWVTRKQYRFVESTMRPFATGVENDQRLSKAQLQKTIAAVQRVQRERSQHPAAFRPDHRQRAKLNKSRAASEKMLAAFFQQAGLNLQEFEALQQRRDSDLAGMVEQHKADALQRAAGATDTFYSSVRAQIQAWQDLSPYDFFPYPTFTLDTPEWIGSATPLPTLDWERVSFASWAKFKLTSTESGTHTQRVSFYFFWDNPYQEYEIVNAVTYMSATGHLQAHADWSFTPQDSYVDAYAEFAGWFSSTIPPDNPPTGSGYAQLYLVGIGAESETLLGSDTEGVSVSDGCQLSQTMFLIPPRTWVVFEVALEIDYHNDSGSVEADFESGDFKIECPLVMVEVLYPPPMSG
jgi:hypothetical protein